MLHEIMKSYKKQAIKLAIGWTIASLFIVLFIAFTMLMVEYAIPSRSIKIVIILGATYFVVNILRTITTFYEDFKHEELQKTIEADYRKKIFYKLNNLSQKELDGLKVGEVLENIINDTKEFAKYYTEGICRSYFGGIVRLVGVVGIFMFLNIPISIMILAIYLIGFFITYMFNKKSIEYTKLKREANAKILNWSNEQVEGYSTIKSLEIEHERLIQIKELIKQYEKAVNKLEKNIRIYTCLYDFIVSFTGVITILLGAISLEQGLISYGAVIIISRYIASPETYAKWFIEGFQIRNVSENSFNRIENILKKEEEDIDSGKKIDKVQTIEFNNIKFSYHEKQNILNDISFKANKNESIALVGRTGSGKTSLVNLICRFYDPQEGIIKINNEDYKNFSIKSLRDNIGYIMQKVVIFNGTILENINYANKEISEEKIIDICKKLNLHEKIVSLKDGYNTIITSDTDIFSAGEKQLLNFARVMVENPQIIILDEATASLSYKSEMVVRKAIDEIIKGKISFIIAHRLSTIKKCNKILLMQDGKIIEQGNHDELINKKGQYYQLVNSN